VRGHFSYLACYATSCESHPSNPFLACLYFFRRCGYPFLYETYLYHLHRLDHRHNFSPYFYLMYLTYPSLDSPPALSHPFWRTLLRSPLTSFVPQMTLAIGTGLIFSWRKEDLVFTWFVQSVVFVLFNKVCTSQVRLFRSIKVIDY
jgi:phosphatidylinositol glycan class M